MRLIIISDVHGHSEKAQLLSDVVKNDSPDALIICGDITHFGNLADASMVLKEFTKLTITLFVPGNCDPQLLSKQSIVEGATNLHARCVSTLGANIIGIGGSIPTPFRTPFEIPDDEIGRILDNARKSCVEDSLTILISHNPPYGTKADTAHIGRHVGSKAIRGFIENTNPKLVACGHIHESRAIDSLGASIVVNPGPFDRGYYALAEIGEKVTINLKTLK